MEEMESKYHSMTCQAKSMYQLTCVCGHDANEHSQKQNDSGSTLSDEIFLEDAVAWMPLQGVCLRKDGADPRLLGLPFGPAAAHSASTLQLGLPARMWQVSVEPCWRAGGMVCTGAEGPWRRRHDVS